MKKINVKNNGKKPKIGNSCEAIRPNITESTLFSEDGKDVGFYVRDIGEYSEKARELLLIADTEFRSKRVPKSVTTRIDIKDSSNNVKQYSTIIGSIPPKPLVRRNYPTMSSVHSDDGAINFVKAMMLLCEEGEKIFKEILPEQYASQKKYVEENVDKKWRFGNCFTSSISNYNIAAAFHQDRANIKNTCNIIINRKVNCEGGDLHVPSYDATIESSDYSMIVYPAWRDIHGVTPIVPLKKNGYRNSFVFYPIKAFVGL